MTEDNLDNLVIAELASLVGRLVAAEARQRVERQMLTSEVQHLRAKLETAEHTSASPAA